MSYYELKFSIQNTEGSTEIIEALQTIAFGEFDCLGVNEYNLDESQVDELLGKRSYCGGDVTSDLLDEVENVQLSNINYSFYFDNNDEAQAFKNYIDENISIAKTSVTEQQEEDWNAEWKKHFIKIEIDNEMDVVPSWEEKTKSEDILIYPGRGFGTGSHETTFLCLKLMRELDRKSFKKVFDHGCGSSILGIAAKKHFESEDICLYDIDIQAYENSQQNLELNSMNEGITLVHPEKKDEITQEYDLVFANILLHVLLEENNFIMNRTKTGGKIIISGLLKEQVSEFLEKFSPESVKEIKVLEKGDWAAILLEKL